MFDCSAVFENESLNKHLLQGPAQLNSLTGVLTLFRKEKVAFTCDIEQMFHSFQINPEDRNFLRFLWFESKDLTGPIVEYRMNVHLLGAASSPWSGKLLLTSNSRNSQTGVWKHHIRLPPQRFLRRRRRQVRSYSRASFTVNQGLASNVRKTQLTPTLVRK